MFLKPPYVLYNFFLKISDEALSTEDYGYLDNCLSLIKQEDLNMLHGDIEEIFFEFESDEPRLAKIQHSYKDRFFVKFENIDHEIEDMLSELTRMMENEKFTGDTQDVIELMQDLDLFLFREITVKNRKIEGGKARRTNILVEAMHRGFDKIVDFIFSEGFSNVRSAMKLNNPLEIENEVAAFNISFFKTNMQTNINFLKKLYTNLIDIM